MVKNGDFTTVAIRVYKLPKFPGVLKPNLQLQDTIQKEGDTVDGSEILR